MKRDLAMNRDTYVAKAGPSVDFDDRKFTRVICYIGKDADYGLAAVDVLLSKKIQIEAVVGVGSDHLLRKIPDRDVARGIVSIDAKRPWESPAFARFNLISDLLGVNCGFDYIIPKDILNGIPTLNIHPAVLPLNRGCHHSFWGIMDATPLGATLHWMTEGLDEGPIISQKSYVDDGYSVASKLQQECNAAALTLLSENIELVMNGKAKSFPQGVGTYHSRQDILAKSSLNVEDTISVNYLFDLCRATNNKNNGFVIIKNNRRFRVAIEKIEELGRVQTVEPKSGDDQACFQIEDARTGRADSSIHELRRDRVA